MSFKLAGLDTDARSSETLYRERALTFLKRLAARVWRRIPALIAECVCAASKVLCGSNPSHTGSDAKQLGKEFQASCIDSGTSTRGGIPRSSPLRCERLVLIYKVDRAIISIADRSLWAGIGKFAASLKQSRDRLCALVRCPYWRECHQVRAPRRGCPQRIVPMDEGLPL
jgi:hypothetical protein